MTAQLKPVDFKAIAAKGAYVYCYLRESGSPYYVGLASKGQHQRPFQRHSCKAPTKQRRLVRVLRSGLSLDEARNWERFYIQKFGRKGYEANGILLNQSEGGECGTKGIKWAREIVEKRAAKCRGRVHRKRTDEENEANRQRHLGLTQSAETRARRSASSRGHKKSEHFRQVTRERMLGSKQSTETRHKHACTLGQLQADEFGLDVQVWVGWSRVQRQRVRRAFDRGIRGAENLARIANTEGRHAMKLVLCELQAA